MGHFDFLCTICGVHMSIGRTRTASEPTSSAWQHDGREFPGCWPAEKHPYYSQRNAEACPPGCTLAKREGDGREKLVEWPKDGAQMLTGDDGEWLPEGHVEGEETAQTMDLDEDEPLEYDEDEEGLLDGVMPEWTIDTDDHVGKEGALPLREIYKPDREADLPDGTWKHGFMYMQGAWRGGHSTCDMENYYRYCKQAPEHIAGPDCRNREGYSGARLSLDEMNGCRTWRCLVKKPEGWELAEDDRLFEQHSDFYLSGEGNGSSDLETHYVIPRHGRYDPPQPTNIINVNPDTGEENSLPAHSWCIDMYARAAMQRHGTTDLDGLWLFRQVEMHWRRGFEIPYFERDHALLDCHFPSDEPWTHIPGTEWLVANPVEIPGLAEALDICQQPEQEQDVQRPQVTRESNVLAALPLELLRLILDKLDAPALGAMHNTSAAFRGYTQDFFRKTVRESPLELWELNDGAYPASPKKPVVWDALCPSWLLPEPWPTGLPYEEEERLQWQTILELQPELGEAMPAALAVTAAARQEYDERRRTFFVQRRLAELSHREQVGAWVAGHTPPALRDGSTNWHTAWRLLLVCGWEKGAMKGLRNRKRVWKDIQEILDRVETYRGMGVTLPEFPHR